MTHSQPDPTDTALAAAIARADAVRGRLDTAVTNLADAVTRAVVERDALRREAVELRAMLRRTVAAIEDCHAYRSHRHFEVLAEARALLRLDS